MCEFLTEAMDFEISKNEYENLKNINICFLFIGKYLIVSEDGHEIVDLLNPNAKYEILANNVPRVSGATGGLLQNLPIRSIG